MTEAPPFVSIIVPTHERPHALRRCLLALARQDYPRERYEVIVMNDGGTAELVSPIAEAQEHIRVTLVHQRNAGPAAARNTGADHATGQFLAFTDDDCTPAPDWLGRLAARLDESPHAMIGGRTVNVLSSNPFSTASQLLVSYFSTISTRIQGVVRSSPPIT